MKLQNLIYATMVACAFSACSNDDDPNIPDPAQELDATLTVAFSAVGSNGSSLKSTQTKTDPDATANATIKKIGIAVFNAGAMGTGTTETPGSGIELGGLISYKERELDVTDMDSTACVDAKSGEVEVLVVANPSTGLADLKTKAAFIAATTNAAIDPDGLLMSSTTYKVMLSKGRNVMVANDDDTKNKFTAKGAVDQFITSAGNIKVFRNVANIQLNQIKVDPRPDFGGTTKDATFKLKKVYVMHYLPSVRIFGDATKEWCTVKDASATITSNKGGALMSVAHDQSFEYKGIASYANVNTASSFFVYDNSSTTKITDNANVTALVIQGDYTYKANNGAIETSTDAYWTVFVNNDAPQAPTAAGYTDLEHCGVLRNVQYSINATITGPGSPDPEIPSAAASLTANVEVVPWGQITLTPDID